MPFKAKPFAITSDEQDELRQMSLSRSPPAGGVFKARLILMLTSGRSYAEIQRRLDTTAPTISHWKKRFLKERVPALIETRHPGRKPTVITPKLQARVLEATRRKPKDGSTHWSVRIYSLKSCASAKTQSIGSGGKQESSPIDWNVTWLVSTARLNGSGAILVQPSRVGRSYRKETKAVDRMLESSHAELNKN